MSEHLNCSVGMSESMYIFFLVVLSYPFCVALFEVSWLLDTITMILAVLVVSTCVF